MDVAPLSLYQKLTSGKSEVVKINDIDVRNYARFVLTEGSILEKRELLGNLKGRILLKNKLITVSLNS